jgi:50S ribosomal subunit-associated GTPase HflX
VLNKIDLISKEETQQRIELLKDKATTLVSLSALKGTNIEQIKNEILRTLRDYVQASFTIPITKDTMAFMGWLFNNVDVRETNYDADSVRVVFEAEPSLAEKVRSRVEKEFNGKLERIWKMGKQT